MYPCSSKRKVNSAILQLLNAKKAMKISVTHPTGNANSRFLLEGLYQAKMLKKFYTTVACFEGDFLHRLSSQKLFNELKRRQLESYLKELTYSFPHYEAMRVISSKMGWEFFTKHEEGLFSVDSIYRTLDKKVASKINSTDFDIVYAYEDGALETFKRARQLGIKTVYELPIGYCRAVRVLLAKEMEDRPDWANTLTGFKDSENKLIRKDLEISLADEIFVASSFTESTLKNYYLGKLPKIHVVPYGFPTVPDTNFKRKSIEKKIKFLFVGGLSQRKGIANIFEALVGLENYVELTIVGKKTTSNCEPLNNNLLKYKWYDSLTNVEVLNLMKSHDVFLFPSLFEGFGLVITEAMSQGTPVITTNRTIGGDIINQGENGWLVEAGSTESLRNQLESILINPKILSRVSDNAFFTAKQRPWKTYGREMADILSKSI